MTEQQSTSVQRSTSVVLDPVAMNIVNKIAKSAVVKDADCTTGGGIMVEGKFAGTLRVTDGPLVLLEGAHLAGRIEVDGDAYIFGIIGSEGDTETIVTVRGEIHLTNTCVVHGRIRYVKIAMYHGANVFGSMEPA